MTDRAPDETPLPVSPANTSAARIRSAGVSALYRLGEIAALGALAVIVSRLALPTAYSVGGLLLFAIIVGFGSPDLSRLVFRPRAAVIALAALLIGAAAAFFSVPAGGGFGERLLFHGGATIVGYFLSFIVFFLTDLDFGVNR